VRTAEPGAIEAARKRWDTAIGVGITGASKCLTIEPRLLRECSGRRTFADARFVADTGEGKAGNRLAGDRLLFDVGLAAETDAELVVGADEDEALQEVECGAFGIVGIDEAITIVVDAVFAAAHAQLVDASRSAEFAEAGFLDLARRRAAIAVEEVPIVTGLAGFDDRIAAGSDRGGATRFRGEPRSRDGNCRQQADHGQTTATQRRNPLRANKHTRVSQFLRSLSRIRMAFVNHQLATRRLSRSDFAKRPSAEIAARRTSS